MTLLHPCLSIPSSFLSYINASPFICRMELKSSLTRWQLGSISAQRGEVETIIVVNRVASSSWETFKVNYIFCTYNWKCIVCLLDWELIEAFFSLLWMDI